jgi:transcriptional regulator with XRE-family HTH domain
MNHDVVVPAQVRAARALIGWSQEQLAQEAEVGLSTVRDFESEKRAADTGAVAAIRRALWNGGVVFTPGGPGEGPGVRLVADRPNMIRRPTTIQKWEGMPFGIEWQGRAITVFVAMEVMDDLDGHPGHMPDEVYLKTFERHRGRILGAAAIAVSDPENFDRFGRLYIRQKDMDAAQSGHWHVVTIASGEDIRDIEARALINKFASVFIQSGIPPNVEVYRRDREEGGHIFYFSPMAAMIAKELLAEFKASACAEKPELNGARRVRI